jgi:Neuraminidase (sialidase)
LTTVLAELPHAWFFFCRDCQAMIGLDKKSTGEFQKSGKKHVQDNPTHQVWLVYNDKRWSTHRDLVGNIVLS